MSLTQKEKAFVASKIPGSVLFLPHLLLQSLGGSSDLPSLWTPRGVRWHRGDRTEMPTGMFPWKRGGGHPGEPLQSPQHCCHFQARLGRAWSHLGNGRWPWPWQGWHWVGFRVSSSPTHPGNIQFMPRWSMPNPAGCALGVWPNPKAPTAMVPCPVGSWDQIPVGPSKED